MAAMARRALGSAALLATAASAAAAGNASAVQAAPLDARLRGLSWQKTITLEPQDGFPVMGLCMDLAGGVPARGTLIQSWECNGMAAQVWIFDTGSYHIYYGAAPNLCVDAGDMQVGTPLQVWECNDLPQQKWVYDSNTKAIGLVGADPQPSICMFGTPKMGMPWSVAGCSQGPGQRFNIWYGTTIRVNSDPQKCLSLKDGNAYDGALVEVTSCRNLPQQQWVFTTAAGLIIYGGNFADPVSYCLDMHDMRQGNHIFIWTCNGYVQQKWAYDEQMLTLYAAFGQGVCLDLEGGDATEGKLATIYNCNGCWNQKWILSLTRNSALQAPAANRSSQPAVGDCPPQSPYGSSLLV